MRDVRSIERVVMGLAVAAACALTLATMGRAASALVIALIVSYALWLPRLEWPPAERILPVYAAAVLVQCAHLVEEYQTGFYRVFPPVFAADPWSERQFLLFNLVWLTVFVVAGVGLARRKRPAYLVAIFLALGGGIGNGLGHLALSAREGGYFPGAYTGALALLVGSALAYRLMRRPTQVHDMRRGPPMSASTIGMLFCFSSLTALGCASEPGSQSPAVAAQSVTAVTDTFAVERDAMVDQQIRARGIKAPAVLKAMRAVPRHRFVPPPVRHMAYRDQPLPIGSEQTISQPYIVAYMTEAADISSNETVLEIGTGSGYQAAVLGEVAREVYTIEIIPALAEQARRTLAELGYTNVHTKAGNGYLGWPERAPFDAILVTAAPEQVPQALVDQLAPGGRMVVPVGAIVQDMMIIEKTRKGVVERRTIPVRFVPMTGKPQR